VLLWSRTVGLRWPRDPHWGLTTDGPVPECASSCVWTTARECLHAADVVVVADMWDWDAPPKYVYCH
jgi:hypothetical protein